MSSTDLTISSDSEHEEVSFYIDNESESSSGSTDNDEVNVHSYSAEWCGDDSTESEMQVSLETDSNSGGESYLNSVNDETIDTYEMELTENQDDLEYDSDISSDVGAAVSYGHRLSEEDIFGEVLHGPGAILENETENENEENENENEHQNENENQNSVTNLQCKICLSSSIPNEPVITTCGHIYCKKCILRALRLKRECPLCRSTLTHKNFTREETETELFEWLQLKEIYHESRCHAISFAPETSFVLPKLVTFCAAGADFVLRIFRSDFQDSDTVQELRGHTNYINDVAWEEENNYLASVSDDHTCKIWDNSDNFESVTTFCLNSAGMSVKWHPDEPNRVLVAEKNGIIHMYNAKSQQVVMSLESPKAPLMSADWSFYDRTNVIALAVGDIITWDLKRSSRPSEIKHIHEDGGRIVQFCPSTDQVSASVGRDVLKVLTSKTQVPLIEAQLKLFGGMCWHHRLPYVAAAIDRKLCFWKVQIK